MISLGFAMPVVTFRPALTARVRGEACRRYRLRVGQRRLRQRDYASTSSSRESKQISEKCLESKFNPANKD
jgi:hypothetical protein